MPAPNTANELKRERESVIQKMRDLRATAAKDSRMMNADETKQFDELDRKQEEIRQEAERETKLAGFEQELRAPVGEVVIDPTVTPKPAVEDRKKKFDSFGDFLQAVHRASEPHAKVDPRLEVRTATGLGEVVPSDGGYLVQKDFLPELLTKVYENGRVASRCRRIPVGGNGLFVNAVDESSRATGSRWGGVQGYWVGEGDQKTASRPKFRRMDMPLQKLVGLCYSTDEMLQDSTQLESVIRQSFIDEFAFLLDDAIINGDGVGKPLGILNSPCLVTQAKDSGDSGVTVTLPDITAMDARLFARSDLNAVWYINQDTKPKLQTLALSVGNNAFPALMPMNGGVTQRQPGTLYGKPYFPIEQCQTLGTVGDIILGDFSEYILIDKGGIASDVSMHVRFIYDESTFRFVYRVNGQPAWNKALTPFKGTATQSPFIALAARA